MIYLSLGFPTSDTSQRLEIFDLGSRGIVLITYVAKMTMYAKCRSDTNWAVSLRR